MHVTSGGDYDTDNTAVIKNVSESKRTRVGFSLPQTNHMKQSNPEPNHRNAWPTCPDNAESPMSWPCHVSSVALGCVTCLISEVSLPTPNGCWWLIQMRFTVHPLTLTSLQK